MTKLLYLLFPVVLMITCSSGDDGSAGNDGYFQLESGETNWSVTDQGARQDYTVKSNGQWNIIRKSIETWAEAKPTSGENDGSFSIKVAENKTGKDRSMQFAFMLNGQEVPGSEWVTVSQEGKEIIYDEMANQDLTVIKAGIPAYAATELIYRRDGSSVFSVEMETPVLVGVADKPEGWGYFQFPNIRKSVKGNTLVASWSMSADSESSYGKGGSAFRLSDDNGKTWYAATSAPPGGELELPNGGRISVNTPVALDVKSLQLPEPIATAKEAYGRSFTFYRMNELPEELQGVYINYYDPQNKYSRIHATLDDQNVVRYASGNLFPIVWWGNMKLLPDNSVMICIYPAFYENETGGVSASGVAFYRSTDYGMTWKIKGNIPYVTDLTVDPNGNKRLAFGYTEPYFEILKDGTYLCVMRTTDGYGNSPMYISRSTDHGATWSKPVPFTPSGVLPKLIQLENGVTVMASGRPGMQLRFSNDGKGEKWTDPFEMLPFESENDEVSCGYPSLLVTGSDSFLLIYSDFKYLNQNNEIRKAIKIREVTITPK
ncbi:MAG: exo-alpha-sialidase [Mangrovibacterium sp.]|nr:exo-alpha-sialidase [Mangrovibacterium sp.]